MKSIYFFYLIFSIVFFTANVFAQSPNSWVQKANCDGITRNAAVGFSIGGKGYIGTGIDADLAWRKDFWEYNPVSNSWTQKGDFGGIARDLAVGFGINGKGYIGVGTNGPSILDDFWEYDPTANEWTQKVSFGGGIRYLSLGFSIGDKGYIGTGADGVNRKNDFWEYNPTTNEWTQKANFPGTGISAAVGFSVGNKGYIGTGELPSGGVTNDFWEYDPASDTWIQKAHFGGAARWTPVGFSIGEKGYIGTGQIDYETTYTNDFWVYTTSYEGINNLPACSGTLKIFPNPTQGKFYIETSGMTGNAKLAIFNVNGFKVLAHEVIKPKFQIDISNFPQGVYFIRLVNNNKVEMVKVIKELKK